MKDLETRMFGAANDVVIGDACACKPRSLTQNDNAASHVEFVENSSTQMKKLAMATLWRRGCANPEVHSDEVVAEAHVKILKHWNSLVRPERAFYRITINEAKSHAHKCRTELTHMIHVSDMSALSVAVDPTEIYEAAIYIEQLLSQLHEVDQSIISLRLYSGLDFEQIAEVMEMPFDAIRSRYYRALSRLKQIKS